MLKIFLPIMVLSLLGAATTNAATPPADCGSIVITVSGVFTGLNQGDTLALENCDEFDCDRLTGSAQLVAQYSSILLSYVSSAQTRPNSDNQLYLIKGQTEAELDLATTNVLARARNATQIPVLRPTIRTLPGETSVVVIGDKMRIRILKDSWKVACLVDPLIGQVATIIAPCDMR